MLEIALRLTPAQHRAKRTADALRRELMSGDGLRLVSIDHDGGRTVLVVAVDFGEPSEIRSGTGRAQQAMAEVRGLLDRFRDCDPAFVSLPDAA